MLRIGIDLWGLDPTYRGGVSSFSLDLVSGIAAARIHAAFESELAILTSPPSAPLVHAIFGCTRGMRVVDLPDFETFRNLRKAATLVTWLLQAHSLRIFFD